MDETTVAKALQTDLNSHKVKIQVKWVGIQLYILASRDDEHYINYEFLFSLIQSRLEQLKIPSVEGFTLYGKVSGNTEPEWKKVGLVTQYGSHARHNHVDTLVVTDGKVDRIKSEYDPSHVYPHSTRLINDPLDRINRSKQVPSSNVAKMSRSSKNLSRSLIVNLTKVFVLGLVIFSSSGIWLIWKRSQYQQIISQAQVFNAREFNFNRQSDLTYNLVTLEGDRQNIADTLSGLNTIPDRPFSLYQEAQAQISPLQTRLVKIDRQLITERNAVKALESAQKLAETATAIAKNPPHKPTVWRTALNKWQQALTSLRTIPVSTSIGAEGRAKIKVYTANYESVKFQLQKQLIGDAVRYFLRTETGTGIQVEMRELKTNVGNRVEFMNVCTPFVSFNLDPVQVKTQQVSLSKLSVEMCVYLWAKK